MGPGILEFLIHIDQNFPLLIDKYGFFTYVILCIIIIFETGLVLTTFLPGDSLLFVAGASAAAGLLSMSWLIFFFFLAAVAGYTLNYWIGHHIGVKVLRNRFPDLVKKEYLDRTNRYFARFGGKTIFIARFIPIIRTFAPFLAGVGAMSYRKFIVFNILSAIIWAVTITSIGYLFGLNPFIREHIIWFIYGMAVLILATILLIIVTLIRGFFRNRNSV
ncbi:MAG: VTT domain-containing protein [Methanoregulaceae archaeon]|nr:VTT domain-containing protein [Methanoregulaceae archaeon]